MGKPKDGVVHGSHSSVIADFIKAFLCSAAVNHPHHAALRNDSALADIHINFRGSQFVLLTLSSFVFFYGGGHF
jgi:hypothetical protein